MFKNVTPSWKSKYYLTIPIVIIFTILTFLIFNGILTHWRHFTQCLKAPCLASGVFHAPPASSWTKFFVALPCLQLLREPALTWQSPFISFPAKLFGVRAVDLFLHHIYCFIILYLPHKRISDTRLNLLKKIKGSYSQNSIFLTFSCYLHLEN